MSVGDGHSKMSTDGGEIVGISHSEGKVGRRQIKQMAELRVLTNQELDNLNLIYSGMQNRQVLNVFRELRTKLLQHSKGKNFICMVSSLCPGGGTSYIALNLAIAFALDRSKTSMLIDCNLYDPSIDKLLGLEPEYGLTDFLEDDDLNVESIIYATGVPRVRVVPVGENRDGGAEYFSSTRMTDFFSMVRERYMDRFIIVDTPSVANSAESRILCDLCDFVVLVVPYGKLNETQIHAGIESIDKNKLVGVVFNQNL